MKISDYVGVLRVVVTQFIPLLRTRGDHERARCDHVRLEPPEISLDADADIAARGKTRHLIAAVRHADPRRASVRNARRDLQHLVRNPARQFDGSDRDAVLGRGRRDDAFRTPAHTAVVTIAAVARSKYKQHRLRTGFLGQSVADRRIITRRGDVIALVGVTPTVVGDQRIRPRRRRLQLKIAEHIVNGHDEQICGGCLAPVLVGGSWIDGTGGVGHSGGH